jgi:hypothetical protein
MLRRYILKIQIKINPNKCGILKRISHYSSDSSLAKTLLGPGSSLLIVFDKAHLFELQLHINGGKLCLM